MQVDLGATHADLELLVGGYLLTFACVLLVGGRFGDVHGRKRLILVILPLTVGRDAGWPEWTFWALAAGAVLLGFFTWHLAQRSRADPSAALIPWSLLRHRSFSDCCSNLVFFLGVVRFLFYFVIYLETGAAYSPLRGALTKLCCGPRRATAIVQAILVLQHAEDVRHARRERLIVL